MNEFDHKIMDTLLTAAMVVALCMTIAFLGEKWLEQSPYGQCKPMTYVCDMTEKGFVCSWEQE
jgi:hypothetical protein